MVETLASITDSSLPLAQELLQPIQTEQTTGTTETTLPDSEHFQKLNAEQASIVKVCLKWAQELAQGHARKGPIHMRSTSANAPLPSYSELAASAREAPAKDMSGRVQLVHGPFGSGKSSLLVASVIAMAKHLDTLGDKSIRILVSANTNVAVDRVLLGLMEHGFHDFMRVGSIRKIAKPVLPYSLHSSESKNTDLVKELQYV